MASAGGGAAGPKNAAAAPEKEVARPAAPEGAIPTPTYFAFWSTSPSYYPVFAHPLICSIILFLSATGALPAVQAIVQPFLASLSLFLLRITFVFTAVASFLHQTGALRRYALKFAEDELSKNLNGALITLSDAQVDLWRGKVIVHDLIIHNKERDEWEGDSPCLARVGRIEATVNFASVIQLPFFERILNHTFFDIYNVLVEDVQAFVEKRKNVFNFHLLDPSLDIPDHAPIMEEYNQTKAKRKKLELGDSQMSMSRSSSLEREEQRGDSVDIREEEVPARDKEEEANKIVEKLVGAVSKIGKAANEGGSKGLQSALRNQKDGLVTSLKQLHTQKSSTRDIAVERQDSSWKAKKEHGVSVMRELGKVVEKNVADIKSQVAFLQKPPGKKPGYVSSPPDDIRVGSMLFREARIFTKDILVTKGGGGDDAVKATSMLVSERSGRSLKGSNADGTGSGWAKPIVIFELAVTGAELCPPMSARDPATGMPVVGISMDRLLDILLKRVMAEAARSNTGRLFQSAFGDFSFLSAPERKE